MVDEFAGKKHIIVLKTQRGEVVLGTNDLSELGMQSWFKEFLSLHEEEVEQVQPVQQVVQRSVPALQQRLQQQQQMRPNVRNTIPSSFMDIGPQDMNVDMWNGLAPEQQAAWMEKYNMK